MMGLTICVAGKNRIAIDTLRNVLATVQGDCRVVALANSTDDGRDGWQPSFKKFVEQEPRAELVKLEELYEVDRLLLLSVEFDRLIRPDRFRDARLVNIHFSMLPAYKGMYTSCHPILNGEASTGCTLHRIDPGIDTGEIIDQKPIAISDDKRCSDLYLDYIKAGTELVANHLPSLIEGTETSRPQIAMGSTYYSRSSIDYTDLRIDTNQTAFMIQRQINAFHHRAYQIPHLFGQKISRIEILADRSSAKAGNVLRAYKDRIRFATVDYDCEAIVDRFDDLVEAISQRRLDRIEELVHNDPSLLSEASPEGWTPLIIAAYAGAAEIVACLLKFGADPNKTNQKGTTPLMYAKDAFLRSGEEAVVRMLACAGASCQAKDVYDKTVFDHTLGDMKERLRSVIADARQTSRWRA